jgi:succinate dehydrogenase (ubiquinone) cytochrome b560 subunit
MKRDISPHASIYKFPVTAISSIATRLSGLYLTTGYIGFGVASLYGVDAKKYYDDLDTFPKKCVNYSFIIPSTYHTFGGMRHFLFDKYPSLLTNQRVTQSSYLLFCATLGTSIVIEKHINPC